MRTRSILLLAAAIVLVAPAVVRADTVAFTSGGPKKKAARRQALAALEGIAPSMRVCWRAAPPARVTVRLEVDARGTVTRAAEKAGGAAAQCAAGILAVHELPAAGSAWNGVVRIDTAGAAGVDLHAELRRHQSTLQACGGDARGTVKLRFLIHPDGRMGDAEVVSSTVDDAAVHRCLTRKVETLRVAARPGEKTVSYTLEVGLGGKAATTAGSKSGPDAPRPSKKGPVSGKVIHAGIAELSDRFARCYRKRKDKDARGYVMIRFTIRANGTVRNVKVRKSTLNDSRVEACVVAVGKDLRFPGQNGRDETRVFYPISFAP